MSYYTFIEPTLGKPLFLTAPSTEKLNALVITQMEAARNKLVLYVVIVAGYFVTTISIGMYASFLNTAPWVLAALILSILGFGIRPFHQIRLFLLWGKSVTYAGSPPTIRSTP